MTLRPFWLALQFLTPIPTPAQTNVSAAEWGRSTLAYPLVGVVIGMILVALHLALSDTDPSVQAALLLVVWTLLTGGLHLAGLADSADAWSGGRGDRQRTLEIMKDRRSGPAAITMVGLTLVVKFAALTALIAEGTWIILLLAPVLGRTAIIVLLLVTPYLHPGEAGQAYATHIPKNAARWIVILVAASVLGVFGGLGMWLLLLFAVGIAWPRHMMMRRLGGATEETLRAICVVVEAGMLMMVVLIWGGGGQ